MTETKTPEEIITEAVWSFCIREGKPATAKDIAAEAGVTAAWVRGHWADMRSAPLEWQTRHVPKHLGGATRLAESAVPALRPKWSAMAARLRDAETRISAEAGRLRKRAGALKGSAQHLPAVLANKLDWCVGVVCGQAFASDEAGEVPEWT